MQEERTPGKTDTGGQGGDGRYKLNYVNHCLRKLSFWKRKPDFSCRLRRNVRALKLSVANEGNSEQSRHFRLKEWVIERCVSCFSIVMGDEMATPIVALITRRKAPN